jgi:hypothetical protein
MNRWKIILSILLLSTASCSKESISETKPSDHFSFVLFNGLTQELATTVRQKLEDNYSRILTDLKVEKMDPVKIQIWNDETDFQNDIKRDLGTNFWGATGYVYSKNDVRVLNRGNPAQTALHEFCHAVSIYVNSRIGNNPRWLWEAVAIYESGEFINPKTLSYLVTGNFPTITELNTDFNTSNKNIYSVGYILSEYIIQTWGKEKYIDLVKANGDIQSTLGVSVQQFESGWKEFVTKKYL